MTGTRRLNGEDDDVLSSAFDTPDRPEAVITLTHYGESCEEALLSVLRCKKHLSKRIHIVRSGFMVNKSISPDLIKKLADARIELVLHGDNMLSAMGQDAVVHLPPDVRLCPSALQRQLKAMYEEHEYYDHFCVPTKITFENYDWRRSSDWISMLAFGFLNLIMFFDVLRSALNLTKYHRACDVRVQKVIRTWPNKAYLAPVPKFRWLIWTRISGTEPTGDDALQIIDANTSINGWNFVLKTLYQHPHMGFSIRWWFAFSIYYALFSYPWWNHLLTAPSQESFLTWFFYRDIWSVGFWMSLYAIHLIFVSLCIFQYQGNLPFRSFTTTVLLYPVYLAVFPIVYGMAFVGTMFPTFQKSIKNKKK